MELSISCYSEAKLKLAKKLSGKGISEYLKTKEVDFMSRSFYPIILPDGSRLEEGRYICAEELRKAGVKSFVVRYNRDMSTGTVKL
jgi:hypothetical protein